MPALKQKSSGRGNRAPSISAREYEVMLHAERFAVTPTALAAFGEALVVVAESIGIESKGNLEATAERAIVFLDTPDYSFHRAGLILRQRDAGKDAVELTLKAISPDPHIAGVADVRAARVKKARTKFEEDIGAPFQSRFARSTTTKVKSKRSLDRTSATIGDAIPVFPALGDVQRDGIRVQHDARLGRVNGLELRETVFSGAELLLPGRKQATVAVIIWSETPHGRPLVGSHNLSPPVSQNHSPPSPPVA